MNIRIRNAALVTLACGGFLQACQRTADPEQLRALDAMINSVESAMLTLNELDAGRYHRADSVFVAQRADFALRFQDTLDRTTAGILGNHYLLLRAADNMGRDHDALVAILKETGIRIRALRHDLINGSMDHQRAETALATERVVLQGLDADVGRALDNYRSVQRAWEEQERVNVILAHGQRSNNTITP